MEKFYDICVADYPRLAGETDDAPRIQRAIDAAPAGVVFFPRGNYDIAAPVTVNNNASLYFHKLAVLSAVEKMDYVLKYEITPAQTVDLYRDRTYNDCKTNFINGGEIDGRGLASCLFIKSPSHFTVADISLRNGYPYGMRTEGGCEIMATNIQATVLQSGLKGNIAFSLAGGDSHFTDCVSVDYTIGFDLLRGSNRITRGHVWGGRIPPLVEDGPSEGLIDSICFRVMNCDGNDQYLEDCYADSGYTGFEIHDNTRILGGTYFAVPAFKLDDVTVIKHYGGYLLVDGGLFRVKTDHGVLYKGTNRNVVFHNNRLEGVEMYLPSGN